METPPPASPPPLPNEPSIAGFWRRFLGVFVDSIFVGLIGWGLGFLFFDYFASLGGWGRIFGFAIGLIYYGLMNSRLCHGRTIGKRFAGTRVIARDGQPIGLGKSAVRYLVLALPVFLNGAPIPPSLLLTWVGLIASLLVFGFGGAIIYLIVFNRRTRQSLHDLIVGSFVVKRPAGDGPVNATIWKGHYVVVILLLLASMVLPIILRPLANGDFFKPIVALQSRIVQEPEVSFATVYEGFTQTFGQGGSRTATLNLTVALRQKPSDFDSEANKIADIVLHDFPRAQSKDQISILVAYGFDIGIARLSRSQNFAYSPAEWANRIKSRVPAAPSP